MSGFVACSAAYPYIITVSPFGISADYELIAGCVAGLVCGLVANRGGSGDEGEATRI